jgi:integrase
MTPAPTFESALGPVIDRYLALKRALGRGYYNEWRTLARLDLFLANVHADLDGTTFTSWCDSQGNVSSGVRRHRMRGVRNLCLYRRRTEPSCFVPDLALFPPLHQPVSPHIFTEPEIAHLLQAATALARAPDSPLRPEVYRLALVLLYTAGLRRGELTRLTVADYDPTEHTVLVRASKFHKSRLLPLSADASCEVAAYLAARRERHVALRGELPLLWSGLRRGRAYSGGGIGQGLRSLLRNSGIKSAAGRSPRVHDLRHTFAVHALLRWYRAGADVQSKLPFLAAYMGHVSIASTQYYLPFVETLAQAASERFARHCGKLIASPPVGVP